MAPRCTTRTAARRTRSIRTRRYRCPAAAAAIADGAAPGDPEHTMMTIRLTTALITAALAAVATSGHAQQPASPAPAPPRAGGPPAPVTGAPFDPAKVPAGLPAPKMWTAQEDHQNMMDQLGIKALRPGPSGNEQAPNHANYDEAT